MAEFVKSAQSRWTALSIRSDSDLAAKRSSSLEQPLYAWLGRRSTTSYWRPTRERGVRESQSGSPRSLRSAGKKITEDVIQATRKIKGKLTKSDGKAAQLNSYADDYILRGIRTGQRVAINLSAKFDGYLQLLNARNRRELLYGDNTSTNTNARMVFTAKAGMKYRVRVSSSDPNNTGKYTLHSKVTTPRASHFDFFSGFGLVNASAAVAYVKGQNLFADMPDLGGDDWGLDLVNAPEVWQYGFTGQGVTVAVIDSGMDYNHPELQNRVWLNRNEIPNNGIDDDRNGYVDDVRGWNFVSNTTDPADDGAEGHGTHVSGIIAAERNGTGITGVAYNAQMMPLKVLNRRGIADSEETIAQAIYYAVNNGARIINMSLGGDPGSGISPNLKAALHYARQANVAVVIASGNDRQDLGALQPSDPAFSATLSDLAITVGALGRNRQMYIDSDPAGVTPIDFVVAPGIRVKSTLPGATYASYDGTSMATAYVSGVIALMLSANPNLTPAQIEAILTATANPQVKPSP